MSFSTFAQFAASPQSEKIGLVTVEAAKRLVGWVNHSGNVWKITSFSDKSISQVIQEINDERTSLSSAAAIPSSAGTYYHDRDNSVLYAQLFGNQDPTDEEVFTGVIVKFFFSNVSIKVPHDLSTGYLVDWVPLYKPISESHIGVDNINQFGNAIEGAGSIGFINDKDFWQPIFDKYVFENQNIAVYLYNRDLAITEAKLLFKGKIEKKSYSSTSITFSTKDLLKALKNAFDLPYMKDAQYQRTLDMVTLAARIPQSLNYAFQRSIYGYVSGFRPTNIDQLLDGYPVPGTVTATNNSEFLELDGVTPPNITRLSSLFTSLISVGDKIFFEDDETEYSVDYMYSMSVLVINPVYQGTTGSSKNIYVVPQGKQNGLMNRTFQISNHPLCRKSTNISAVIVDSLRFDVDSVEGFVVGDAIEIGDEQRIIESISGTNTVQVTEQFDSSLSVDQYVYKSSVKNVRMNDIPLVFYQDYSYNENQGQLFLNENFEFNHGVSKSITGSLLFATVTTLVVGTSTLFTSEIEVGDFLSPNGTDWYLVRRVIDDTNIWVNTYPIANSSASGCYVKKVSYYQEGSDVITCDVVGRTADGDLPNDVPLYRGPEIVKDILERAGITNINETSFTEAVDDSGHFLGLAIPDTFSSTKSPILRDVISKINKSVFGLLLQNSSFDFAYSIIQPHANGTLTALRESDIISLGITSDGKNITKRINLSYAPKEYDHASKAAAKSLYQHDSDYVKILQDIDTILEFDTYLINESSARIFAQRLSFLLELSTSIVKIKTKLQGSLLSVNDPILLTHDNIYERIGSSINGKIGLIRSIKKTISDTEIEIDDLGNSFSRCAKITENDAQDFSSADDIELLTNGYITENDGSISAPGTIGTNLIW